MTGVGRSMLRAATSAARHAVADYLELRSTVKHRSRLGRRHAPAYTEYWRRCQAAFGPAPPSAPELRRAVDDFHAKGFTSFWTEENGRLADAMLARVRDEEARGIPIWDDDLRYRGELYRTFPEVEALFKGSLGNFLTTMYGCHFKIFYGILYKSERLLAAPAGSQLWHADGGPGTCTNVMFYLKDVEPRDGAMECLPWAQSLALYGREQGVVRAWLRHAARAGRTPTTAEARDVLCTFYRQGIEGQFAPFVEQPTGRAGLVLPFRNNIVHRGGYPEAGRTRYVCVFHVYPSDRPLPVDRYRTAGIAKSGSYLLDPAAVS